MKVPKAETTVLAPEQFLPGDPEREETVEAGSVKPAISRRELAKLWSELLEAAPTDARARKFVAYFRADAERIFATGARPRD